jgi:hypothetical protein
MLPEAIAKADYSTDIACSGSGGDCDEFNDSE